MSQRVARWVCSCCPAAVPPRAPCPRVPSTVNSIAEARVQRPPTQFAVNDYAHMPPPSLPFAPHTNSRFYVPLLLHAAGMASPETRALWAADASIGDWWRRCVDAVSARPFLPVGDTLAGIALVAQARGDDLSRSPPFQRLVAWAAPRSSGAESLSVMLRAVAVPGEGHYLPAAIQEGFLTLLLGQHGALALERDVDALRQHDALPFAAPSPAAPPEVLPNVHGLHQEMPAPQAAPAGPAASPAAPQTRPHVSLTDVPDATHGDQAIADRIDEALPAQPHADPFGGASPEGAGHSAHSSVPAFAWSHLDDVDLAAEFSTPVPTLQSVPAFLRPGVRQAFVLALRALREAYTRGTAAQQIRAWKLFLLAPRLLLHRAREPGTAGREALLQRTRDFLTGRWDALLSAARAAAAPPRSRLAEASADAADGEANRDGRRAAACASVRRGEVSRARGTLTSAAVAPGTDDTFAALSDPQRRPPATLRDVPAALLTFQPASPVVLTDDAVAQALRTARRGTAAGLSGATCEHYKLLLDDAEALELFVHAANLLAAARVPADVAVAVGLSRLTALRKPGGGVRGIATGDTFRRLVSRSLARAYADTFDEATRPYQFALQTRAGTDALSGMLRAAVDLDSAATIVSLDGRSAYDTISRAAFLHKLHAVAPALLPFVRLWYGQQSTYFWWDANGERRTIHQGEGCEQGDALAPALYALGQHDALVAADQQLRPGECLAAFLDDVYLVTTPARAREALDAVASSIEARAGVAANLGKTRAYNRHGGPAPPGIAELGASVWRGDAPEAARGFVALGTPIGHPQFVAAHTHTRLLEEARLLQELPLLPDLQCAWLLLAMCASPRADHLLRTLPPDLSASYARGHDDAVWRCLLKLLGEEDDADPDVAAARRLALLPAQLGGLGLQCAERTAPAAYWAAWADALPVLRARRPDAAARCLAELDAGPGAAAACLRAADEAGRALDAAGWRGRPSWPDVHNSLRPPQCDLPEPGERSQGWQHHGSRACSTHFRETELLPALPPPAQAMLRSQSGPHAAAWLGAIPGEAGSALPPDRMLLAMRRRLRLPLPIAPHRCGAHGHGCGAAVDAFGDHHAACPRTGLLARRAKPLEHAWVRIAREAVGPEGQVVPQQWLARTSAPGVDSADRRRLDFVVYGATPLGEALCCDVTLVSPLTREGRAQPSAASRDGAAIAVAERRKRAAYPELLRPGPQRLCVLACEAGGRWSVESIRLVTQLVRLRAQRAPAALRLVARQGWLRRWWGFLSIAQQSTLAATLLGTPYVAGSLPGAQLPPLGDVLHDAAPPSPSLLGP